MKTLYLRTTLTALALATAITTGLAQLQPQLGQQSPDSVVVVVADALGLSFVPPDQRQFFGTFWEVRSSLPCITAPLPFPPLDPNTAVYAIGDAAAGGQFLVDETAGQVTLPQSRYGRRTLSTADPASILQAQVDELQNFVAQVRARQADALLRASAQMGAMAPDGQDGGGVFGAMGLDSYTTGDLWLEIIRVTNSVANFTIHTPDTAVYDLFGTTNLSANVPGLNLTNWVWLLRTDVGQTNNIILTNLWPDMGFFRLGTMLDSNSDGVTDAYSNLVGLNSISDLDGDGVSDVEEMREGRNPMVAGAVGDASGVARLDVFTVLR